ncbi:hypothetical protein [Streptosporangium sp. NPDC048865]|uniref:hypothetical protein n=1 Tax=Streptosporangium sp. NPDC048865 TaxID=3155766 RepID=UPI00344053CF
MSNVTATAHEPWCTDHYTGTHPDDGHCRRPASAFPEVYLSTTDDGPMVLAHTLARDEFTPEQDRAYGLALLGLADAARTAVAA